MSTPDLDPRLVTMRVKRIRQAEKALATVKRTLVTYLSEHAASTCQARYNVPTTTCTAATDGILVSTCGHHEYLCAMHGSGALRAVEIAAETTCILEDEIHDRPVRGISLEWVGLA